MAYVWMAVIGFVVGLVARAVVPGGQRLGIVMTAVLGVVGALAATWAGEAMGWYGEGETAGFIASVIGAALVLVMASRLKAGAAG